jgi:hypothetical protein
MLRGCPATNHHSARSDQDGNEIPHLRLQDARERAYRQRCRWEICALVEVEQRR